jgi:short-subunit dehydrogenase
MGFKGKHVWIIGASSGIGRALAFELAQRGARLTLSARNAAALEELLVKLPGSHSILPFDVTNLEAFYGAAATIGTVEIVILLAGTYTPSSIADIDIPKAQGIINTNLLGALHCAAAVLPILRRQKRGQIAFCGSVAGYRGLPNAQPYAATKAAIISLAETTRIEESKNGIDVRLINPGFVETPMTSKNTFPMPMMISSEKAARAITAGLEGKRFKIHFPKRLTLLMKLLKILPDALYFSLAGKL